MNRARFAVAVSLAAALAVAGLAGAAALAGPGKPKPGQMGRERPNPQVLPARDGKVNFTTNCRFSHTNFDDPIVHPGRANMSHQHSFVGNRTTAAGSTLATLKAGGTTCAREADKAAYWVPTLFKDGKAVQPVAATVYYRRRSFQQAQTLPQGLKVVAGNAMATSPQGFQITFWNCGADSLVRPSSSVPTCPDSFRNGLRLHVRFPSCWDGRSLDSADHKSHMAYPDRGRCPSTHAVAVPELAAIFRYPINGGPNVTLASGGQYSAHADFFNAWDAAELKQLVDFCLNGRRHCQSFGP